MLAPLHQLTKKDTKWKWKSTEEAAFRELKKNLCEDTVLAHFQSSVPIGISCDASEVGIGAVLYHCYPDSSECPIANVSKTLTETQCRYSLIQKEALVIIFALKKLHQFLYGCSFILVTDHKPLIALFGPYRTTPVLAANRLARWALMLNQYQYSIEYRKTSEHGKADALSRLPAEADTSFDGEGRMKRCRCDLCHPLNRSATQPHRPWCSSKGVSKRPSDFKCDLLYQRRMARVPEIQTKDYSMESFRKISMSLSVAHGCLLNGSRVVIPSSLQPQVLQLLHLGHFGIQRVKQLAHTAVYWPGIDRDIMDQCQRCSTCAWGTPE